MCWYMKYEKFEGINKVLKLLFTLQDALSWIFLKI